MRRAAGLALLLAGPAAGEVVSADAAGFETRAVVAITAPPARVWSTLVAPARWWNPSHTFSGNAANLSLDARPGGCFCEKLPGGGVEHLHVTHVDRGRLLRMAGGLGPLGADAVAGVMTFALTPAGQGTTVTLTYRVAGRRSGGFAGLAPAVDRVLAEQVGRLKASAETR